MNKRIANVTIMALLLALLQLRAGAAGVSPAEVNSILTTIDSNYAPARLKKVTVGLDWPSKREEFRKRLLSAKDSIEFYMTVSELLGSLQDAHVSVEFPSDYSMKLPIQFYYAEGKTFVTYIDGSATKNIKSTIEIGDELLLMDGKTPDQVRLELNPYLGIGNRPEFLTLYLAKRDEKKGLPVPLVDSKTTTLKLLNPKTQVEYEIKMDWKFSGVSIINRPFDTWTTKNRSKSDNPPAGPIAAEFRSLINAQHQLINMDLSQELGLQPLVSTKEEDQEADTTSKGSQVTIGNALPHFKLPRNYKPIEAPLLAGILVQLTGLSAGTFKRGDKTVGFLRIPSYVPQSPELSLFGIRYIMAKLQETSDYLIIDQTHNGGGYVLVADWIVTSLVQNFDMNRHMNFAAKPTQSFLRMFASLIHLFEHDESGLFPESITKKYLPYLKREYAKVLDAYQKQAYLSEPISLAVTSKILEDSLSGAFNMLIGEKYKKFAGVLNSVLKYLCGGVDVTWRQVYTKPVYMLINELDFSGGDATPAMLRDYDRVTLIGTRTAGAGGSVAEFNNNVMNEFKFRLTNSLMIRPNKQPYVENYGVSPDITLEPTISDFNNGFEKYFERVLQTIEALP